MLWHVSCACGDFQIFRFRAPVISSWPHSQNFSKKKGGGVGVSDYGLRIDKFLLPININNQILKNQTGFFVKKTQSVIRKFFKNEPNKKGGSEDHW